MKIFKFFVVFNGCDRDCDVYEVCAKNNFSAFQALFKMLGPYRYHVSHVDLFIVD